DILRGLDEEAARALAGGLVTLVPRPRGGRGGGARARARAPARGAPPPPRLLNLVGPIGAHNFRTPGLL
ncbi:hypothetical protein, partial [Streptomyces sp. NPDC054829]